MSISNELYMALLAMGSYNRGYGQGLHVEAAGASATQIGNATIGLGSRTADSSAEVVTGFYAASYTLNGQTVMSYRAAR